METFRESIDCLEPLSDNDAVVYTNIYAERLPTTIQAHHFLLMQLRWKQLLLNENNQNKTKFNLRLLRPRQCEKKFCTFFGVSDGVAVDSVGYWN